MPTISIAIQKGGSGKTTTTINLAAALLNKPSLLALDEATANIDHATDAFVQNLLRKIATAENGLDQRYLRTTVLFAVLSRRTPDVGADFL